MKVYVICAVMLFVCLELCHAEPVLRPHQRVAIVGDSITQQRLYSRYVEQYLVACMPELDVQVMQFGWNGETAGVFFRRMTNDLLGFMPDVVTTCYGMNDGGYQSYKPETGKNYGDGMRKIVRGLKAEKKTVVVGSPGVVDSKYFRGGREAAAVYNETLGQLAGIAQAVAKEEGGAFVDVHSPMMAAMSTAKAALGNDYDVAGTDGVHPRQNGHLVMAYAFLKGMGFDGNLGTITVDLKGTSMAEGGHKILKADKGVVELESSRYPFCFGSDEKSPLSNRSILPYVPFNRDLNRLMLVVRNVSGGKARIKWGKNEKSFTAAELAKGINLAEEFIENPFCDAFAKVDTEVYRKQIFETTMIQGYISTFPELLRVTGGDPDIAGGVQAFRKALHGKQEQMSKTVRAAVRPVKHAIAITEE